MMDLRRWLGVGVGKKAYTREDIPIHTDLTDAAYAFVQRANQTERLLAKKRLARELRLAAVPRLPSPWHGIVAISSGLCAGAYTLLRVHVSGALSLLDVLVLIVWVFAGNFGIRMAAKRWPG
jgi:hypothetical protein